jgi:hypothetical protein
MASSAIWVLVVGAIVVIFDVRRILRVEPVTSTTRLNSTEST